MVFVGAVPREAVEGENVIAIRVRHARCDLARHIVTGIENPASTLSRQNL
jgi:hypothetical protein